MSSAASGAPYDFYAGLSKRAERFSLGDVVDTNVLSAKAPMLNWLDATISRHHFAAMKESGVEVVRVPCGYWNWVTYTNGTTPNAPDFDLSGFPVVEKFRNLQSIAAPGDYRPYFDKIFEYAVENEIHALLDLHGVPGSQNGEIHSGVVTGFGQHPAYYFETAWNRQKAVEAIGAMAQYVANKSHLFGIEVINEPQSAISHAFLMEYYREATLKVRDFLPATVPVILFSWAYDFHKWFSSSFDEGTYGTVYYGTHIYHMGDGDLTHFRSSNWPDYELVRGFAAQGNHVFVGEWTLA